MKNGILKDPATHNIMTQKMELTKSVPFIDNKALNTFLDKKTKYTSVEKKNLMKTNTKSQKKALQVGFGSFGIMVLFFILFTFNIPTSYAKTKK
jgi:hypothetical protein